MTFKLATAAVLVALAPAAVLADTVTLAAPGNGATLQGDAIDMSIVFTDGAEGAYEVAAAYVSDAAPDRPNRLLMALQDGDEVSFSLPGHPETLYSFERRGAILSVTGAPVGDQAIGDS